MRCVALALVLSVAGCLDGSGDGWVPPPVVHPTGPFLHLVTNDLIVATSANEEKQYGLDLDLASPPRPDNSLGHAFVDAKPTLGIATNCGVGRSLPLLHSIQAADLRNGDAGWHVYLAKRGALPSFAGADRFAVDPIGPSFAGHGEAYLPGTITDGHFVGGPGTMPLELTVGCGHLMRLHLYDAHIEADITESSCTGKLGGAISTAEIETVVVPTAAMLMNDLIATCPTPGMCTGFAKTARDLFDKGITCSSDADCPPDASSCLQAGISMKCACGLPECDGELAGDGVVSVHELLSNALMQQLLAPDLNLLDAHGRYQEDPFKRDGVKDSLSVGVGFTCVKASFDAPGEL